MASIPYEDIEQNNEILLNKLNQERLWDLYATHLPGETLFVILFVDMLANENGVGKCM